MSAEPGVRVWRVVIGIPSTTKNCSNFDSTLQALLPKSKTLKFLQAVLLCSAVYDCVPQKVFSHAGDEYCSLDGSAATRVFWVGSAHCILELPSAFALVVQQAGVVVALLEKEKS
jgi:hypothetical protein